MQELITQRILGNAVDFWSGDQSGNCGTCPTAHILLAKRLFLDGLGSDGQFNDVGIGLDVTSDEEALEGSKTAQGLMDDGLGQHGFARQAPPFPSSIAKRLGTIGA